MGWGGRREGGSGWGTHVNPWLIHVNVWQKPLQYCKVISLQLIKINEKENHPILQLGKDGKEFVCNAEDLGSIPGLGRSPGVGNGNPLQYSCLENSMDRETWWARVHGVKKSQTRLSYFHFSKPYHYKYAEAFLKQVGILRVSHLWKSSDMNLNCESGS